MIRLFCKAPIVNLCNVSNFQILFLLHFKSNTSPFDFNKHMNTLGNNLMNASNWFKLQFSDFWMKRTPENLLECLLTKLSFRNKSTNLIVFFPLVVLRWTCMILSTQCNMAFSLSYTTTKIRFTFTTWLKMVDLKNPNKGNILNCEKEHRRRRRWQDGWLKWMEFG